MTPPRPAARSCDLPAQVNGLPAEADYSSRARSARLGGFGRPSSSLYPCRLFMGMAVLTHVTHRKPTRPRGWCAGPSCIRAVAVPSIASVRPERAGRKRIRRSRPGCGSNSMQTHLPIIGSATRPKKIHSSAELAACNTKAHACRVALLHSGMSQQSVAERIHVTAGYLSMLLSGKRRWQDDLQHRFMNVTGSLAPLQWDAIREGAELYIDPVRLREAELLEELEEIRRAA